MALYVYVYICILTRNNNLITGYEQKCCRGCPRSDDTARRCLDIFKPRLDDIEGDSWEELDTAEIANGAQSLRWLVWVGYLLWSIPNLVFIFIIFFCFPF